MSCEKSKLCACSFGTALGIVWGASVFLLALSTMWFGYGASFVSGLSSVYWGYSATWLGSLIGLVWGFVDLFVAGFLVAFIYNRCCNKGSC